jgi:YggT family protein
MNILKEILSSIITVVSYILYVYMWIVILRAIISWVSPNPYNPIVNFLYTATEPVLRYVRRIMPPFWGSIDLSPLIVLVVIEMVRRFLLPLLEQLVARL